MLTLWQTTEGYQELNLEKNILEIIAMFQCSSITDVV